MNNRAMDDVGVLVAACERDLGSAYLWFEPDGYPHSLALCILDSLYSTGAHYTSVRKVVERYRAYRAEQGGNADTDGITALQATIEELGGPDPWATRIGNRRPTSTAANAPLKSEAIRQVADALAALDVETTDDLRAAAGTDAWLALKSAWRSAPGQRSGLTWDYALMLARVPGVKADRMVIRYVARAIGVSEANLRPADAAHLVKEVAEIKAWDVIHLDHAIWRYESGRPFNREGSPADDPSDPDA